MIYSTEIALILYSYALPFLYLPWNGTKFYRAFPKKKGKNTIKKLKDLLYQIHQTF